MNPQQYKINKACHLFFVCLWLGAAFCLIGGNIWIFFLENPNINFILRTLDFIDWYILVPGATGVVITGTIFSLKSNWGWGKKYFWIRAKWIISIIGVMIGTFILAPWMHDLIINSASSEFRGLLDQSFANKLQWLIGLGLLQTLSLVYAIYLSIFKPA